MNCLHSANFIGLNLLHHILGTPDACIVQPWGQCMPNAILASQ